MSTRAYRLALVGSVLAWFLLGLHAPILHQITAHHRAPHASVLAAVAVLAAAAVAGLLALLRDPRGAGASDVSPRAGVGRA